MSTPNYIRYAARLERKRRHNTYSTPHPDGNRAYRRRMVSLKRTEHTRVEKKKKEWEHIELKRRIQMRVQKKVERARERKLDANRIRESLRV